MYKQTGLLSAKNLMPVSQRIWSRGQNTLSRFGPTSADLVWVATLTCECRVQYPIELKSA